MRSEWMHRVAPLAALLLIACGEDSGDEDRTPPPAPAMRAVNCDGEAGTAVETGVDADGAAGFGIRLEWDMAEEPDDLAGFQVYRSEHPDSAYLALELDPERFLEGRPAFYHHVDLDPAVRATTFWGPRFWYYVRAVDRDGNLSAPSDTVTYRLWAAPRIQAGQARVEDDTLTVDWQFEFVDLFQLGFRGFRLLVADPQGVPLHREEVRLNLEPQMRLSLPLAPLGLGAGDYQVRVDTIIERVAQVDSLLVDVRSNPRECPLSGSESFWISVTF